MKVKLLSRVLLLATPWTAAYQAPPSMGFSRQEYWSGVPLPSPSAQALADCKNLNLSFFFIVTRCAVPPVYSFNQQSFQQSPFPLPEDRIDAEVKFYGSEFPGGSGGAVERGNSGFLRRQSLCPGLHAELSVSSTAGSGVDHPLCRMSETALL